MCYSPYFVLPSSPTMLGVRGGDNRYSPWETLLLWKSWRIRFHFHLLEPSRCPLCLQPLLKVHLILAIIQGWTLNREIMKHQSFTFVFIYLSVCLSFIYLAGSGLSCGMWDLYHIVQIFRCRALTLYLGCLTSVVATGGLNCSETCGTRVCRAEIKPHPLCWEADSYPLDCPGSPLFIFLIFYLYLIILGLIILKIGHVNISPTQDRELRQRGIHMSFPSTCFS